MALTFTHSTQRVGVPQADASPLLLQTLINAIRDEEESERGIVHDQIAVATGKDDLGGGAYTGITVALLGGWKLDFQAGAYQATLDGGNLADALARIANTGNPQVLVRASAAATVVATGSGVTAQDKVDIAQAVGQRTVEGALSDDELMRLMAAMLLGKVSGAGTATEVFRDTADAKDRVTMTVDASGNRTAVTLDPS